MSWRCHEILYPLRVNDLETYTVRITASIDILPAVRGLTLPNLPERALPLPLGTGPQIRLRAPFAYILSYAASSLRVNAPVEPEVIASPLLVFITRDYMGRCFPGVIAWAMALPHAGMVWNPTRAFEKDSPRGA